MSDFVLFDLSYGGFFDIAHVSSTLGLRAMGVAVYRAYAHSKNGRPVDEWEPLEEHLCLVARLARDFANAFSAGDWGEAAGLWHDIGKYSAEFQAYLREQNGLEAEEASQEQMSHRPRHAIEGARHARKQSNEGVLLAYCIAGHHGGLNDTAALMDRLESEPVRGMPSTLPPVVQRRFPKPPQIKLCPEPGQKAYQISIFTRMIFSSLVDADFLATERFMAPERSASRPASVPDMRILRDKFASFLAEKQLAAPDTPVNRKRKMALAECRNAALSPKGIFTLTVPTGGGKTFSSMAFALDHAVQNQMRRVIYAIPFTSIIEQNADALRKAFGEFGKFLLEHHSNLDPRKETLLSRLASENWDLPVVITTNVQLFESLYAHKPSACRKLHRIANSVIVLDEAQSIPVKLLQPCLAILQELVRNYGCTLVLCTATQPAISLRDDFPIGIEKPQEIIPSADLLYREMRRVEVRHVGPLTDADLISCLAEQQQVLCIVNTRAHAVRLFNLARDLPGTLHLSASMCPQHRSRVIRLIRSRLRAGVPCRVISTQLVEAGVDLDFPAVYRAMAGLDSIAQAAGRCNREGRRNSGKVYVFDPECPIPGEEQRMAADSARDVISRHPDILSLEAIEDYFRIHYWRRSAYWDKCRIMECFAQGGQLMNFTTASHRFQMIQDTGRGVVIPYGRMGRSLRQTILTAPPEAFTPGIFRTAQRLTVQIPDSQWDRLLSSGAIGLFGPGESIPLLLNRELYDRHLGLKLDTEAAMEVESLIV